MESPQLARCILKDGSYQPLCSSDVYALGQLSLEVVGGHRAQAHEDLLNSPDFLEEVRQGRPDPTQAPAMRRHLTYLRHRLSDPVNYADQVLLLP